MQRVIFVLAMIVAMAVGATASASQNATSQSAGVRRGPVAKLIEMERRKNQWLRQRFGR
ncbi:MAG: hypothetical protein ACKOZU_07820 [Planctomycetaceae bacterium]